MSYVRFTEKILSSVRHGQNRSTLTHVNTSGIHTRTVTATFILTEASSKSRLLNSAEDMGNLKLVINTSLQYAFMKQHTVKYRSASSSHRKFHSNYHLTGLFTQKK